MKPVVWMFSGQGSQYYGMGADLYASEPIFRSAVDLCDEIVEPLAGASLVDVLYRPREDRFAAFDRILHSNPALVAVQYGVARVLLERGLRPDCVLGYSMGEVTGAIVAGALSLEDGLRIAVLLGEVAERHLAEGAMLAVLAEAAVVERRPERFRGAWVAARNFPGHFVLSGQTQAIGRIARELAAENVTCQPLPVRFAFHSPLIEPMRGPLLESIESTWLREPGLPLVSSAQAGPVARVTPESLWTAIRQPVAFERTIAALEARGPSTYVDLGPAGTLATFLKYLLGAGARSKILSTVTPFGRSAERVRAIGTAGDR